MNAPSNKSILKAKIATLKLEREQNLRELNEAFQETTENLKPGNLIKRAFANVTESNTLGNSISKVAIGLASGFLVKKTLFSKSKNIFLNIAALLVESFVANAAANNSEEIKAKGGDILHSVIETITSLYHKFRSNQKDNEEDSVFEDEMNVQT